MSYLAADYISGAKTPSFEVPDMPIDFRSMQPIDLIFVEINKQTRKEVTYINRGFLMQVVLDGHLQHRGLEGMADKIQALRADGATEEEVIRDSRMPNVERLIVRAGLASELQR